MTREKLDLLPATEALRLAGLRHEPAKRTLFGKEHDVYRISDGTYVATISAHEAHDLAARILGLKA